MPHENLVRDRPIRLTIVSSSVLTYSTPKRVRCVNERAQPPRLCQDCVPIWALQAKPDKKAMDIEEIDRLKNMLAEKQEMLAEK